MAFIRPNLLLFLYQFQKIIFLAFHFLCYGKEQERFFAIFCQKDLCACGFGKFVGSIGLYGNGRLVEIEYNGSFAVVANGESNVFCIRLIPKTA
jgi:hypothetical protein